jgi:uncharacterized membrane protein
MIQKNNFSGFFKRNRVNKADRPVMRPDITPIDWLLEAMALLGLMILLGYVIYSFPRLPDTIPSHFLAAGTPDDYSSKSSFWVLPGITIFIYGLLTFIALVPHQFNYTVIITPGNALRQYTMAIRLIRYLKAVIIWMFFYINWSIVQVANKNESGLGIVFVPVFLGLIFLPLIFYFVFAYRAR